MNRPRLHSYIVTDFSSPPLHLLRSSALGFLCLSSLSLSLYSSSPPFHSLGVALSVANNGFLQSAELSEFSGRWPQKNQILQGAVFQGRRVFFLV